MTARTVIFALAGVALLIVLLVFTVPPTEEATSTSTPSTDAAQAAVTPPKHKNFQLTLRAGQLASGPARMQVQAGDRVVIEVTTDSVDELHLHGYDLKLAITPGAPATLDFVADHSGRFEIELHKAHHAIGALEVYPRR